MIWILGGNSNVTSGDKNDTGVGSASKPVNTPYIYQQSDFSAFSADVYWSAAEDSSGSSYAWTVNFSDGSTNYYYKSGSCYVRCVRDEW